MGAHFEHTKVKWLAIGFLTGLIVWPVLPGMVILALLAALLLLAPEIIGSIAGHLVSVLFLRKRRATIRVNRHLR